MFSVGLDEFENLILYAQLIAAKIENNKLFISPDNFHSSFAFVCILIKIRTK